MVLARFVARRLLITVLTLAVVSIMIFAIVELLPGDVARLRVGQFSTSEQIELARKELGLDRPFPVRYADWAGGFLTGDWGESWRLQIEIAPLVRTRVVNSAVLAALALAFIVPVSVAAGVLAALRRGGLFDRTITVAGHFGIAIPEFVSSMFLVLVFSLWLNLLPSTALVSESAPPFSDPKALVLPVVALSLVLFGYLSRMVRASMVEQLRANYTRTAVLKGLDRRQVVVKHVLRNALLPTITAVANQVSWLVGGLVVVENVFNYPGLGQLLLNAALTQDVPMLEVTVLIVAAVLMLANLAADLVYGVVDPRVRVQPASR
jgi:peptide/nickel transport system permease protein